MTQSLSTIEVNQILTEDVDSVLNWLKSIESGNCIPPKGFNWHSFAEAAAFDAREDSGQEPKNANLKWAEVAVTAYEKVAVKTNPSITDALMCSSMMLRVSMISQFGVVAGHPVLDIDAILNWFETNLKFSFEEVLQKAQNWKKCQVQEIRELRKLKNRLQIISVLADSEQVDLSPEVYSWLALRDELP